MNLLWVTSATALQEEAQTCEADCWAQYSLGLASLTIFAMDVGMRAAAEGLAFFLGKDWMLNTLEVVVVLSCTMLYLYYSSTVTTAVGRWVRPVTMAFRLTLTSGQLREVVDAGERMANEEAGDIQPVLVYCVYLKDILDVHSGLIAQMVRQHKNAKLDLCGSQVVKAVIAHQWKKVRTRHMGFFAFYSVTFVIYAAWCGLIHRYVHDETRVIPDNMTFGASSHKLGWTLGAGAGLSALILLLLKLRSICKRGASEFIGNMWNVSETIASLLVIVSIFTELVAYTYDGHEFGSRMMAISRHLSVFAVLLLSVTTFQFLRGLERCSALVRLVIEVISDMQVFILYIVLMVLIFALVFYILGWASDSTGDDGETPLAWRTIWLVWKSFVIGEMSETFPMENGDHFLVWCIFGFGSMLTLIVMLNLLIAIMSNTYERVASRAHVTYLSEKASMIHEFLQEGGGSLSGAEKAAANARARSAGALARSADAYMLVSVPWSEQMRQLGL